MTAGAFFVCKSICFYLVCFLYVFYFLKKKPARPRFLRLVRELFFAEDLLSACALSASVSGTQPMEAFSLSISGAVSMATRSSGL